MSSPLPRTFTGRISKKNSLRYDLRRRVLVSNMSRAVSPKTELNQSKPLLPSKPQSSALLDLIKDIPTDNKKLKQQCQASHEKAQTPEKKTFRIDPSVLARNPIIHTPVKKTPPKRRLSEPLKDTISLHLLRDEYVPPNKKEKMDGVVLVNPGAGVAVSMGAFEQKEFHYDVPPARPVPLPRRSRISPSPTAGSRPGTAASTSSSEDPLYDRIDHCSTGSKKDLVKYGITATGKPNQLTSSEQTAASIIEDCVDRKRRNSLPINSGSIRLRPRFSSISGECRAKKSLLFSESIDNTKAPSGLTLKNIYADHTEDQTPLKNTISKIQSPPDDRLSRTAPKILNQSGIYSNNTLVVDSGKLKKDEVDKSYGFTCRMRPMLRALNGRTTSQLLPSKVVRRKLDLRQSPAKMKEQDPPTPPPRPLSLQSPRNSAANTIKLTPSKEIAVQTSFVVHGEVDCPQTQKSSAKKRKSSKEFFAEVGAKVRRRSSIIRDRVRRSLEMTPGK